MMAKDDCLLCGAERPGSHAVVEQDGVVMGRVCASHTLKEIIQSLKFLVTLEYDPEDETSRV